MHCQCGAVFFQFTGQINSLLKRAYKYGFSTTKHTAKSMANEADKALFDKIQNEQHELLPTLKAKGHSFEEPRCTLELPKKNLFI